MNRGVVCGLMALCATAIASAQQGGVPTVMPAERRAAVEGQLQGSGGMARATVEARVTRGAPYSGDAMTEFTQILGDGNRISRKSVTRNFRDSEGRTRREQNTVVAGGGERISITIVDPVAGTSFVLDPENRIASRHQAIIAMPMRVPPGAPAAGERGAGGRRGGGGAMAPVPTPDQQRREAEGNARVAQAEMARDASGALKGALERSASGNSNATTENLGQQVIEGVMAEGTRTTTIIPAGGIGNAQPIKIVSEQWFAPDLQLLVMTRHSDPRSGETTYRLTNIIRGEQDRSLFEVPADYTVKGQNWRVPMQDPR